MDNNDDDFDWNVNWDDEEDDEKFMEMMKIREDTFSLIDFSELQSWLSVRQMMEHIMIVNSINLAKKHKIEAIEVLQLFHLSFCHCFDFLCKKEILYKMPYLNDLSYRLFNLQLIPVSIDEAEDEDGKVSPEIMQVYNNPIKTQKVSIMGVQQEMLNMDNLLKDKVKFDFNHLLQDYSTNKMVTQFNLHDCIQLYTSKDKNNDDFLFVVFGYVFLIEVKDLSKAENKRGKTWKNNLEEYYDKQYDIITKEHCFPNVLNLGLDVFAKTKDITPQDLTNIYSFYKLKEQDVVSYGLYRLLSKLVRDFDEDDIDEMFFIKKYKQHDKEPKDPFADFPVDENNKTVH